MLIGQSWYFTVKCYSVARLKIYGSLMKTLPHPFELFAPLLEALKEQGGSGTNDEIEDAVVKKLGLSEELASLPHKGDSRTEIGYRLAWARTHLGQLGALENKAKGVWSITQKGIEITPEDISKLIKNKGKKKRNPKTSIAQTILEFGGDSSEAWKLELLKFLKEMHYRAFVDLAAWILRHEGFSQVRVTDGAKDRGIDGVAERRVGLFTERVYFQCKRYSNAIGSDAIRDFQGSISGKHGKGIFFTNSYFTAEAKEAAHRDGSAPIELIDGREFCDLMMKHELGTRRTIRTVEDVIIDYDFLRSLEKVSKRA